MLLLEKNMLSFFIFYPDKLLRDHNIIFQMKLIKSVYSTHVLTSHLNLKKNSIKCFHTIQLVTDRDIYIMV